MGVGEDTQRGWNRTGTALQLSLLHAPSAIQRASRSVWKVLPWTDLEQDPSPTFPDSEVKLQCHLGHSCTVNTQGTASKHNPGLSAETVADNHNRTSCRRQPWCRGCKPSAAIMQTHRTHKNVTQQPVEEEAGKQCGNRVSWRSVLTCLTIICISNLSGDTWAIAKCSTIWYYPSPIFFNHLLAHLDNDFAWQIPNPWVIVMQTGLQNLKKGNGEENTFSQLPKDQNPQELKIQKIWLLPQLHYW